MAPLTIELKWSSKRFTFQFEDENELEKTTVRELKAKCQKVTEVKSDFIKLLANGAVMRNDEMTLADYNIRDRAKVMMMGSLQKNKKESHEQEVLIKLQSIRPKIGRALAALEDYQLTVEGYLVKAERDVKKTERLLYHGRGLGEELMQILMQLDTLLCESLSQAIRQERKDNVNTVQGLLDRLDNIKRKL
ncbi:hypothetical protein J3Q64DRAFT_1728409 [Phycomyces blakesleeanus]|uniref:Ubiquitin-like domain-containing protein n=2 Tax=Phycomyces blakesleeanus TaxID=4837 RepID=A0A167NQP3_PHYB8|nr:hypothetical protein PHYBLDRAFT_76144 [Phycomyces blakesleeanus NRRL 1555(-)]OAD76470.1 hypothetical protein PHYBLDRAFT_76144 [Phycomyces blakesleeanus NRRL 1555(-)]|eukprot:XP_018294510.1 hypothetical protein PHYBLDRAFT_76144 [Phycomyces blakesleeanus NRRL 1555(-)]